MEQDIKILEDYIELIKKGYCEDCNELCNIYGTPTYPANKISEATEHLIKAYKELEEKNKKKSIEIICYQEELENSIPVSLVEETIEELNKQLEEDLQDERKVNSNRFIIICQCKNCLQKLLEKRK